MISVRDPKDTLDHYHQFWQANLALILDGLWHEDKISSDVAVDRNLLLRLRAPLNPQDEIICLCFMEVLLHKGDDLNAQGIFLLAALYQSPTLQKNVIKLQGNENENEKETNLAWVQRKLLALSEDEETSLQANYWLGVLNEFVYQDFAKAQSYYEKANATTRIVLTKIKNFNAHHAQYSARFAMQINQWQKLIKPYKDKLKKLAATNDADALYLLSEYKSNVNTFSDKGMQAVALGHPQALLRWAEYMYTDPSLGLNVARAANMQGVVLPLYYIAMYHAGFWGYEYLGPGDWKQTPRDPHSVDLVFDLMPENSLANPWEAKVCLLHLMCLRYNQQPAYHTENYLKQIVALCCEIIDKAGSSQATFDAQCILFDTAMRELNSKNFFFHYYAFVMTGGNGPDDPAQTHPHYLKLARFLKNLVHRMLNHNLQEKSYTYIDQILSATDFRELNGPLFFINTQNANDAQKNKKPLAIVELIGAGQQRILCYENKFFTVNFTESELALIDQLPRDEFILRRHDTVALLAPINEKLHTLVGIPIEKKLKLDLIDPTFVAERIDQFGFLPSDHHAAAPFFLPEYLGSDHLLFHADLKNAQPLAPAEKTGVLHDFSSFFTHRFFAAKKDKLAAAAVPLDSLKPGP